METNRGKVIRELDKFYYYILNTNLAERIGERDIMTIIKAAALLAEDDRKIKELTEENERLRAEGDLTTKVEVAKYDEGQGLKVVFYANGNEIGKANTVNYNGKQNAFLHGLEVKAEYRNKGYGSRIMAYMIVKYGVHTLYVECDNANAIHLYEKHGFIKIDRFIKEGKTYLVMTRDLSTIKADKAYYDLACEVEDLRAENERLRAVIDKKEETVQIIAQEKQIYCDEVHKLKSLCEAKDDIINKIAKNSEEIGIVAIRAISENQSRLRGKNNASD